MIAVEHAVNNSVEKNNPLCNPPDSYTIISPIRSKGNNIPFAVITEIRKQLFKGVEWVHYLFSFSLVLGKI